MYKNGISYFGLILLILLSHMSLLAIILFRGNYEAVTDVGLLAAIVLGTDLIYFCVLRLMRQATYTADFALVLLLNMIVIFQSCFGGVGFAFKHYLMAVGAFVFCQIAYLLTRDAVVTERRKPIYYVLFGVLMLSILLFTGSRGIWIDLGFITLQPSEFLKPVFVLLCATSISAQQNKKKTLGFMIVRDNWYVYGCTVLIVLLLTALLVVGIRFASKTYTESMRLSEAQELCSTLTSVISDKLRFCGTVTQDENGGLTQIFIQNVGSVEGKGDAFQIGEDGQLALGDRHLLGSASYPKGLQVTAFTLRYDASTDIFSVTLEIGDRSRQTLSQTSFEVKRINRTVT